VSGTIELAESKREEDWHGSVRFVILDTRTGCASVIGPEWGVGVFQMSENNWACDCNRDVACGVNESSLRGRTGLCRGRKRFLVIGCDAPGWTFRGLNRGYPDALLDEFEPYWELQKGLK
jgi:hypothetical protein